MKKIKLISGILSIAVALILSLMALFFPGNGFFAVLWDMGIATFRGVGSLAIIYFISGFFLIVGVCLLVGQVKINQGGL